MRLSDSILLNVFKLFPPSDVIFKDPGPRPEAEYADEIAAPFWRWFGLSEDFVVGKDILDLGCGFGGRTVRFAELGACSVSGIEISEPLVSAAQAFAERKRVPIDVRVGVGESIPFPSHSFDVIAMNEVLEHVVNPRSVFTECLRVLRPGGQLAVVFPPYYGLTGGSHLHGYATTFPGLNLLFSTRALRSATQKHLDRSSWPWREFLRDEPTDKLWNQNGLTVRGFRRLVAEFAFEPAGLRFFGMRDHRISSKSGGVRMALMPLFATFELLARFPGLREAFCHRIAARLVKSSV